VQIDGDSRKALLVSDRAIGTDQNRKFVFVVGEGGKAEYREVRLGPVFDGLRVVRTGVKPGENVIINGLQRVRPGAPVQAQIVPMTASAAPVQDKDKDKDARLAMAGASAKPNAKE
jgi:multidrug efflux system membrane fusion protein